MNINTWLDLFTKKVDPFKGTISNFPRIMERHDSWLDSAGANLTRFINEDRTHLTDSMVDDQWLAGFSKAMNLRQHEALLFMARFFNIKTKKSKEEVGVQTLTVCGMTFMLRTQSLTYEIEKLKKWHEAVSWIILWIGQGE